MSFYNFLSCLKVQLWVSESDGWKFDVLTHSRCVVLKPTWYLCSHWCGEAVCVVRYQKILIWWDTRAPSQRKKVEIFNFWAVQVLGLVFLFLLICCAQKLDQFWPFKWMFLFLSVSAAVFCFLLQLSNLMHLSLFLTLATCFTCPPYTKDALKSRLDLFYALLVYDMTIWSQCGLLALRLSGSKDFMF